jgi:hypothetical protein
MFKPLKSQFKHLFLMKAEIVEAFIKVLVGVDREIIIIHK